MPLSGSAPRIFLSACEASADLHGAHLVRAIKDQAPEAQLWGIGGTRMAAAGMEVLYPAESLSSMGLTEVIGRLGAYREAARRARKAFAESDLAVLIDSPDFNLRLAADANRVALPVVYFIGPKVWAWRRGRLKTIADRVDHMMVILPFEASLYQAAGVPVSYVGNPLVDEQAEVLATAPADGYRAADFGLDNGKPLVALLPGSRTKEVERILPGLLSCAEVLAVTQPDAQFIVPMTASVDGAAMRAQVARCGVPITCIDGRTVEVLNAADCCAMASGTVTLQAALADTPGVIVYRASALTWVIGRRLVKLPNVGLVNLVAGGLDAEVAVMPELLQHDFTAEAVAGVLDELLSDPDAMARQRDGLARVRATMGHAGAPEKAARVVLNQLNGRSS